MDTPLLPGPNDIAMTTPPGPFQPDPLSPPRSAPHPGHHPPPSSSLKPNQVGQVTLYGVPIVSLVIDHQERLCLAQISNTLLKNYSYNEIHNRRVALGITCVQCTPVQLEILRRAGAMPISSRRCGMITKREAERLCKSFLGENAPPKLPDNFAFDVSHECAWGCRGNFIPARYNSSRAKCIKCSYCNMYFSPNKFIFHSHRTPEAKYTQPDAANFNSWRRHLKLTDKTPPDHLAFAWEDVKAMFNGGSRKRALPSSHCGGGGGMKSVGGLPHMMSPPELGVGQKRGGRFDVDDDDLLDGSGLSPRIKAPRSYPLIPVPSKGGFGVLHKFPPASLFPSPYSFPSFGLCPPQKKEDGGGDALLPGGQKPPPPTGLSGLLWGAAGRKDAFYPPFCMFWPPRAGAAAGIPVPTYLQPPPPGALSSLTESPSSLRQAFLDLSDPAEPASAAPRPGLFDPECPAVTPLTPVTSEGWLKLLDHHAPPLHARKSSYHSAFRPVVKDADGVIIAKLHGGNSAAAAAEELASERRLSPASSCSYASESGGEGGEGGDMGGDSEEEAEVDVETKQDEEEEEEEGEEGERRGEEACGGLHLRGLAEGGGADRGLYPPVAAATPTPPAPAGADPPRPTTPPPASLPPAPSPPARTPLEEVAYKKNEGLPAYVKDAAVHSDDNKEPSSFFITETDTVRPEYWRETSGDQTQDTTSPVSLKKDVESMEKEELQKVLLEQIDLRRRLEQEFHALKGNSPFPAFQNFQEQMKRELAYREEMVQQLQMIPYANMIRKEKIGAHLNKS